jgi:membrane-bound serine protease (ClpP class)
MAVNQNRTILSAFLLAGTLFSLSAASASATPASAPSTQFAQAPAVGGTAAVIQLEGWIDDYNRDQLFHRFDHARAAGATTIILEIDTDGGLVTSGLDISRYLKNQTDLHVIAFVNSKAISAGAMIAMACDEIVMTPSGTLGDCAPIQVAEGQGVVPMGATERQKQESPILSDFKESARRNGHDPLLACAMVSLPYSIHWVTDAEGHRKFVDDAGYKTLTAGGGWKPVAGAPDPIDSDKTLLTVDTADAVQYGLCHGTARSADDLAAQRGMTVVARYEHGLGDMVVKLLSSGVAKVIFLIIFINALFVSLKTPGSGSAEAICMLSLGLLIGLPLLTGYAQWWQIVMVMAGIGLIAFEIFVFPGHLVSLVLGTFMVAAGILLTFLGDFWTVPGGWSLPGTQASLEHGLFVTVGGLAGGLLVFNYLRRLMPKMPYFSRLIIKTTSGGAGVAPSPALNPAFAPTDRWPFVGTTGVAVSELKPGGTARFPYAADVRNTSVVSESGFVSAGTKVVVREVQGNRVVVRTIG